MTNLNQRKRNLHRRDVDRKSALSKAKGQVARIAAVLYGIDQAIGQVESEQIDQSWNFTIKLEYFQMAKTLMEFCIEQKSCLGKPKILVANSNENNAKSAHAIDEHRVKRLLELPSPVTVTKISQSRIQRRVENKYRREEAEELMDEAAMTGLGEVTQRSTRQENRLDRRRHS